MEAGLAGLQDTYGSSQGQQRPPLKRRKRTNVVALVVSLFVPWALFTVIFGVMSFSVHYQHANLCAFVAVLGAAIVVACGYMAFQALRRRWAGDAQREPTWYVFVALTLFVGWVLALILGSANYRSNMQPYYDMSSLNTYPGVDPSMSHGQQLLDAGRVTFTRESRLDISRSFGFKDETTYCVAPIVSSRDRLASYDFWAVGAGCCSGNHPDFHCRDYNNPRAHAGLRLMDSGQAKYYRLAIEQAEAAYGIRAETPLLFNWMEDPIGEANGYQDAGFKYYLFGVFMFFAFQLFLVVIFSIGFAQLASR